MMMMLLCGTLGNTGTMMTRCGGSPRLDYGGAKACFAAVQGEQCALLAHQHLDATLLKGDVSLSQ
jgi:hypothetical protein